MNYQQQYRETLSRFYDTDSVAFLLHTIAVIANSDKYHIDRKYTSAADYAADALAFVGLDTDSIDLSPAVRDEFREFRKTRSGDVVEQAQPEDKPESKLVAGLEVAEKLYRRISVLFFVED